MIKGTKGSTEAVVQGGRSKEKTDEWSNR